jgi:hypothetical protein
MRIGCWRPGRSVTARCAAAQRRLLRAFSVARILGESCRSPSSKRRKVGLTGGRPSVSQQAGLVRGSSAGCERVVQQLVGAGCAGVLSDHQQDAPIRCLKTVRAATCYRSSLQIAEVLVLRRTPAAAQPAAYAVDGGMGRLAFRAWPRLLVCQPRRNGRDCQGPSWEEPSVPGAQAGLSQKGVFFAELAGM